MLHSVQNDLSTLVLTKWAVYVNYAYQIKSHKNAQPAADRGRGGRGKKKRERELECERDRKCRGGNRRFLWWRQAADFRWLHCGKARLAVQRRGRGGQEEWLRLRRTLSTASKNNSRTSSREKAWHFQLIKVLRLQLTESFDPDGAA